MLIESRVREGHHLFAAILPQTGNTKQNEIMEKRLGFSMDEFIKMSLQSLAEDVLSSQENRDIAEGYYDWIVDMILYMKGERDELPEMIIESPAEVLDKDV